MCVCVCVLNFMLFVFTKVCNPHARLVFVFLCGDTGKILDKKTTLYDTSVSCFHKRCSALNKLNITSINAVNQDWFCTRRLANCPVYWHSHNNCRWLSAVRPIEIRSWPCKQSQNLTPRAPCNTEKPLTYLRLTVRSTVKVISAQGRNRIHQITGKIWFTVHAWHTSFYFERGVRKTEVEWTKKTDIRREKKLNSWQQTKHTKLCCELPQTEQRKYLIELRC